MRSWLVPRRRSDVSRTRSASTNGDESRFGIDQWITDYLIPSHQQYGWGQLGLTQTYADQRIQDIATTLPAYLAAMRACPPAFGAQLVRAMVLSQARFTLRNPPWHPKTPRRTFGTTALGLLEKPWPNATTGELLSRMEWHAGLAGNAYVVRRPNRLRVLRPDWVGVIYGSELEPDDAAHALDGEIIGYAYCNGGFSANRNKIHTLLPSEVAHWSPIPDPESAGVGMSWLTPAIRDMQADKTATEHKLKFFTNGATPNMVVKGIPAVSKEQFDEFVDMMEERHAGVRNAYRTLYLTAGADATVVGSDLKQIDFKATQGAGETRLSVLSRVPASLLGISEGLAGSSLNAGNFGSARRTFSDTWVHPSLQDVSAALATLVNVPNDAELWFDTSDIPILREDAKDAAEIEQTKSDTITRYVREGFTWDSAVAAVQGQNIGLLRHSGLISVQLQKPGSNEQSGAVRNLVDIVQKVYQGVGVVLSAEEARELLNQAGANLTGPAPELPTPTPAPAIQE
jgi:phage portal protein BeeE